MTRLIMLVASLALVAACDDKTETKTQPAPPPPAITQAPPPPTPEPAPPPVVEEKAPATYVVVRGDTLYAIARAHNVTPGDLAAWNNLENADMLRVGQELAVAPAE
ncbi:LysM domain-containing protein [Emcibacter sp. SYSU 3D8]|uniref:LysM peptidoglycan-binding domain-containing protein n=1 Tax=Emcibacter sp. SYSU 3D8 TaxID=3133969 RepID=UPI0031FE6F9D